MDFITYANNWAKSEVTQAKIMIGVGVLLLVTFVAIIKSENQLLRGTLIPLGLILTVLIGYGSYIINSRPAHVKESIALYQKSPQDAVVKEKAKHINDNKAGKMLLKKYPMLMLLSILPLFFVSNPYYKGMALAFTLLFIATYIIDSGFVTRSDSFLVFLENLL